VTAWIFRVGEASSRGRQAKRKKRYHHGDLRAALLEAAEAELAEKGVEGFTLRACARRAGVSHAAPAHHFADVTALLTEMTTVGFERLVASMHARRAKAASDPRAQFVASGWGYIDFALKNPQHFMLMFGGAGVDRSNEQLKRVGDAAFGDLLEVISAMMGGGDPMAEHRGRINVTFAWSLVHGFAKLRIETRRFANLIAVGTPQEEVDIREVLDRAAAALHSGSEAVPTCCRARPGRGSRLPDAQPCGCLHTTCPPQARQPARR
jgi:AcrR family transcriptional regulator